MSKKRRVLTGITTTGAPHLGNYVGAIRPAIVASRRDDVESFYFMADYHALIKSDDPLRIQRSRLEIAATWLACGLDPNRVCFYRQSDIREIPELTWLLTCVTAKGLMNRAHAYKAAVDQNTSLGEDPDAGITMGLYSYPILMAADILLFNANQVPVGRDQIQHIEMARDIAQRFNHLFGEAYRAVSNSEYDPFVLPEALIEASVATLPGLDGRKMSKSYDNTIPLFEGGGKQLRDTIMRIVTDSRAPGEPKDPDSSALFTIYQAFASTEETASMRQSYIDGIGWGDAKQKLFERVDKEIAPMREHYEALIAKPNDIEDIIRAGAEKAHKIAGPFLNDLRETLGLRDFRKIKMPVQSQDQEQFDKDLNTLHGADDVIPLEIKGPSSQNFSLRVFYTKWESFLIEDLGSKEAAVQMRKRIGALNGLEAIIEFDENGNSILRLTLNGEIVARRHENLPVCIEDEREKVRKSIALAYEKKDQK